MNCNICFKDKIASDFYKGRRCCKQCFNEQQRLCYREKANKSGVTSREFMAKLANERIEKLGFKIISEQKIDNVKTVDALCPYCNSIFRIKKKELANGTYKSCGCASPGKRIGGKYVSGEFMRRLINGAKTRNYEVSISVHDIEELLVKQNFKCALTGWDLVFGYIDINDYTMSVDRINNNIGYTKDNIQIVHKRVNISKHTATQEEFIKMCKAIVDYEVKHF